MTDRTRRRFALGFAAAAACAVLALGLAPAPLGAAPKVVRPPNAPAPAPAKAATPAKATPGATAVKPAAGTKVPSLPSRRPIVLDALHVEGRTEAPRVLFVHAGPTVALEDAPEHPSYLRDDFTAALSSPVRVRVRTGVARSPSTVGGTR